MSITIAPVGHMPYKDQLKLVRAETVTAWVVAALDWMVDALRGETVTQRDVETPAEQRYFGAFYC